MRELFLTSSSSKSTAHVLEEKAWFGKGSTAREKAFIESSGSEDLPSYSTFVNDYDWNAEEDMIASDNLHKKGCITKVQGPLEAAFPNDLEHYGGEDFTSRSRRSAN